MLASEYTRTDVESLSLDDPGFDGFRVSTSWTFTGEMHVRWSNIDLSDTSVVGGNMNIAAPGWSWWLTSFFGVNTNYRCIWNDRQGMEYESSGINTRLIWLLE